MIKEIFNATSKVEIASKILNDLPEWFGIPKYTNDYIEKSKSMPFFAVYDENEAIGFIALKETSLYTLEIFCMGVMKKSHHLGYGKTLLNTSETYAIQKGYKFLQVKTVQEGKYSSYDKTNAFYKASGFHVLEVFPSLWDQHNPCQVMIKALPAKG
jgi:ribosomal protein S18 acetylase RimI-like enzyme